MKRGPASSSFTASKTDRSFDRVQVHEISSRIFSTDAEEIFVEIIVASFTKLLQTRTYNILHTSAAHAKTFLDECVNH